MSRLTPIDKLTPEQQAVYDAMQAGPRGKKHGKLGLIGPFGVWVRAPIIGNAVQALGAAARFETSLPEDVKEIAICVVGVHFRAKFEFAAHRVLANEAGISTDVTDAIHRGIEPDFQKDDHKTSYFMAHQLLNQHRVDEATYREAISNWGEEGVIELISIIGYYCMVSMTLNTFEIPVTGAMQDPWPELP